MIFLTEAGFGRKGSLLRRAHVPIVVAPLHLDERDRVVHALEDGLCCVLSSADSHLIVIAQGAGSGVIAAIQVAEVLLREVVPASVTVDQLRQVGARLAKIPVIAGIAVRLPRVVVVDLAPVVTARPGAMGSGLDI